jgi:histidinol-phosphate phosphatase family protein
MSLYDVVVPTSGRASLHALLAALHQGPGPLPGKLIVVDDGGVRSFFAPPASGVAKKDLTPVEVVRGGGRGPAAARNLGSRRSRADWIAFLDDDVLPTRGWREALADDLLDLPAHVAASQGRVSVPLPANRKPTDWERNTAGLQGARWITADMAVRRVALGAVGGFDERFRRAYREDADLGLRLTGSGWTIVRGARTTVHPVRAAERRVSLRLQAGNADDVVMRALHGPDWRERAGAPRGRLRRHLGVTAAGLGGLAALATGRPRAAAAALGAWAAGTSELAWARIAPGPRTRDEVFTMLWTSAAMPPVAAWHWARGHARARRLGAVPPATPAPAAVLLDRDGTLVEDVPYNGDPARVRPMPGVRDALARLRTAGVALAVVSNQSGIGRGLITAAQVKAVNRRVEELLGPLGPWLVCPHAPGDGCDCRKPRPGLVLAAADRLGVAPERCALIGDIGADVEAARAAGARPVLVPTQRTRADEVAAAPEVAPTASAAVEVLLSGRARS